MENEKEYFDRCIITKVLKTDEDIQYGYTLTKRLSTGCIKRQKYPKLEKI